MMIPLYTTYYNRSDGVTGGRLTNYLIIAISYSWFEKFPEKGVLCIICRKSIIHHDPSLLSFKPFSNTVITVLVKSKNFNKKSII